MNNKLKIRMIKFNKVSYMHIEKKRKENLIMFITKRLKLLLK